MKLKRNKLLAILFSALVAASVCTMGSVAMAAEAQIGEIPQEKVVDGQTYVYSNDFGEWLKVVREEPAIPLTEEEETVLFSNTNYNLVEHPSYLTDGMVPFGASRPGDVWDISSKGSYAFNGEFKGQKSVYTDYLLTGQYSYTVTISCSSTSGSPASCVAYNASSNDKYINGVVVGPGESKTMTLTGLSKTSKVFIKFTGTQASDTMTRISGTIS